jgi:16S rRNA (guanine(527)-N(7))-methyltransferase RsmG
LPEFADLLRSKLAGIAELTADQVHRLQAHYELLCRWNRRLNLTSIGSLEDTIERHYCESVFLARYLPPSFLSIVDIGSGGGFPGIPVAIVRPDCSVTLVESHQRKAVFLKEATRGLANVRVLSKRAEEISEVFDCAVSRAVSYVDLVPILKNIAKTADLLTGAETPPEGLCFAWNGVFRLPWGRNRFLRVGVSRETKGNE